MPRRPLSGVYLITPETANTERLLDLTRKALSGGPALLQYRNKATDPARAREQARALRRLTQDADVPLIINDCVALAAEVGADGVHLGEDDTDPRSARATLGPRALIGVSCYDQLTLAHRAAEAGADYIAFGAFFPSRSKAKTRCAGLDLIRNSKGLGLPRAAIGGITPANAAPLIESGVELLAVIDCVFSADDPAAVVSSLRAMLDNARPDRVDSFHV